MTSDAVLWMHIYSFTKVNLLSKDMPQITRFFASWRGWAIIVVIVLHVVGGICMLLGGSNKFGFIDSGASLYNYVYVAVGSC